MRAVVLREGRLEVRETPDPVPGPGELLLRTLSTAICASDVHFMDDPEIVNDGTGRFVYDEHRDIVLGHEFVGEVIGHGPGVDPEKFPMGSRVTSIPVRLIDGGAGGTKVIGQHPDAQGSFGELLVVSELLGRVVEGDAPDDAIALTDAFAVGESYVNSSRMVDGEIPIVLGAGAIGLSAVAALASRGVELIIVSDFQADRLELAKGFGAHVLVNAGERSPFDVWQEVAAERGSTLPPVVFECVGKAGILQQIVDSCVMFTRIFAAGGWYTGDSLSCTAATHKSVTIQFGGGPQYDDWYGTLDNISAGRLDPLPSVGMVIGLDEVPEALDLCRKAQGPPRIVVHPND